MAKSTDPDDITPYEAVYSGSTLRALVKKGYPENTNNFWLKKKKNGLI